MSVVYSITFTAISCFCILLWDCSDGSFISFHLHLFYFVLHICSKIPCGSILLSSWVTSHDTSCMAPNLVWTVNNWTLHYLWDVTIGYVCLYRKVRWLARSCIGLRYLRFYSASLFGVYSYIYYPVPITETLVHYPARPTHVQFSGPNQHYHLTCQITVNRC